MSGGPAFVISDIFQGSADMPEINMKTNHETDGTVKVHFNFCSVSPLSTSHCKHASKLASCSFGDFPYKRMLLCINIQPRRPLNVDLTQSWNTALAGDPPMNSNLKQYGLSCV